MLVTKVQSIRPVHRPRNRRSIGVWLYIQVRKLKSLLLEEFLLWKHFLEIFISTLHRPILGLYFFFLLTWTQCFYFLFEEFPWVLNAMRFIEHGD